MTIVQHYANRYHLSQEICNFIHLILPIAPPQFEIGCFELDVNIFPTVLANFQESLDYDNVLVTVRACALLAFHQSYRYFGLANKGECRVGPDMKSNYFKPKTSSKCSSFVGETGAVYVYTLGNTNIFSSIEMDNYFYMSQFREHNM